MSTGSSSWPSNRAARSRAQPSWPSSSNSRADENISVIFVQPSTSTRTADLIAEEIGAKVVVVNPLAEDWLDNMQQVAVAFEEALN